MSCLMGKKSNNKRGPRQFKDKITPLLGRLWIKSLEREKTSHDENKKISLLLSSPLLH